MKPSIGKVARSGLSQSVDHGMTCERQPVTEVVSQEGAIKGSCFLGITHVHGTDKMEGEETQVLGLNDRDSIAGEETVKSTGLTCQAS
jgi:hypothetical protein